MEATKSCSRCPQDTYSVYSTGGLNSKGFSSQPNELLTGLCQDVYLVLKAQQVHPHLSTVGGATPIASMRAIELYPLATVTGRLDSIAPTAMAAEVITPQQMPVMMLFPGKQVPAVLLLANSCPALTTSPTYNAPMTK